MVIVAWIAWVIFAFFASQFAVSGLLQILPTEVIDVGDTVTLALLELFIYALMLGIALGGPWLIRKNINLPKIRQLFALERRPKPRDAWSAVSGILVYYLILFAVLVPLTIFLPEIMGQEQSIGFSTKGNTWWELAIIGFVLVAIVPIAEESLMRGLLFGRVRTRLSFWPTAILISVVFAVAHGQINVIIDTFILSIVACHAREKTGSIYASIFMHMIKNSVAFALLFVL